MSDAKPKLVSARWVGPYEAQLPSGIVLIPGETVVEIGEGEAKDSDNWQPVRGSAPKKDED
jgi:hypothetical protein